MKLFLDTFYVRNTSWMTDFDFLTYTGLRMIYRDDNPDYYISLNQVIIKLFGRINISRRIRTGIKESLLRFMGIEDGTMLDISFIKPLAFLDKYFTEFYVDLSKSKFDTQKNPFVMISNDEIRKILNVSYTGSIETVFRYYCVLLSTLNNTDNNFVGNMSLKVIRSYIDSVKAESTQLNYNKILEGCGVLYIHHNDYLYFDKRKIKAVPNFYGRYEDKDKIDKNAKALFKSMKHTVTPDLNVNDERSLRQKYNTIISRKKVYSDNELLALKEAAEEFNARFEDIIKNTKDEILKSVYVSKLYNLDAFTRDYYEHPEKYANTIIENNKQSGNVVSIKKYVNNMA